MRLERDARNALRSAPAASWERPRRTSQSASGVGRRGGEGSVGPCGQKRSRTVRSPCLVTTAYGVAGSVKSSPSCGTPWSARLLLQDLHGHLVVLVRWETHGTAYPQPPEQQHRPGRRVRLALGEQDPAGEPAVSALGTRPYTDEASSSPLMLTRGVAAVTSSLRTPASSSAEPKAGASSCDRRGRVHADRRTFAGHPDSAVDRRDLRQGRGRKRGDTARSGWSLTDDLTRSTRTYPQVTADRTRGNTRRIAVSLACKQGVGGSSPPAGSKFIV